MYQATLLHNNGTREDTIVTTCSHLTMLSEKDIKVIDEKKNFKISTLTTSSKGYILAKFDYLRTIILYDKVIIFKSSIENEKINRFIDNLFVQLKTTIQLKTNTDVFFKVILESILKHIDDYYDGQVENIRPDISSLNEVIIESQCNNSRNQLLTETQKKFINLQFRVKDIKELFQEINSWDEKEINEFNITRNPLYNESIRDLIDSYAKYYEETLDELDKMSKTLDFIVKIIDMNILTTRNKIAKFDINLQILTLAIVTATALSSSLGMNLKNHFEDNDYCFYIINIIMVTIALIIYFGVRYLFLRHIN